MKRLIFLLFCLSMFFTKCKKDKIPPAVLPPVTQEGKNTVGFTINDAVWVPYSKCSFCCSPCREISAGYGDVPAAPYGIDFQFARIWGDKSSHLTISSSGIGTITTTGNKIDSISIQFTTSDEWAPGSSGFFSGPRPGSKFIITKIDYQNEIISGEFEFVLLEQNGSFKELVLKDGRFDFRFNTCKCSK